MCFLETVVFFFWHGHESLLLLRRFFESASVNLISPSFFFFFFSRLSVLVGRCLRKFSFQSPPRRPCEVGCMYRSRDRRKFREDYWPSLLQVSSLPLYPLLSRRILSSSLFPAVERKTLVLQTQREGERERQRRGRGQAQNLLLSGSCLYVYLSIYLSVSFCFFWCLVFRWRRVTKTWCVSAEIKKKLFGPTRSSARRKLPSFPN